MITSEINRKKGEMNWLLASPSRLSISSDVFETFFIPSPGELGNDWTPLYVCGLI